MAVLLCLALFGAFSAPPAHGGAAEPYGEAIRQAEAELEKAPPEAEARTGWGISEALSLTALLAAILLMIWATRRSRRFFSFGVRGREMAVLDRMAISRNSTLILIRIRGRDYWLAESPGGVTRLSDWPAEAADETAKKNASPAPSE